MTEQAANLAIAEATVGACVVPGWNGKYTVTEDGVVTSYARATPRVLKPKTQRDGYVYVSLGRQTKAIHRLVLETFRGPAPAGMEARHLNGDASDYRLSNLEWATHATNVADKRKHGTEFNSNKLTCPQGHPYSAANTYRHGSRRSCQTCGRAAARRYRTRKAVD